MKPSFLVLILASLSACDGPPTTCGPFNAEFSMSCAAADRDLGLAHAIIVGRGLATDPEFNTAINGSIVQVQDALNWNVTEPDGTVIGPVCGEAFEHDGIFYMTLNRRGLALAHEMLHLIELHRGVWNTETHPAWDTKGFWKADNDFTATYQPWGPEL